MPTDKNQIDIKINVVDAIKGAKNLGNEFDKTSKSTDNLIKKSVLLNKASGTLNKTFGEAKGHISGMTAALGVSSLSLGGFIHTAHDLNQQMIQWRRSFADLSDSTGNSAKAVGTWTQAWGESLGSLDEVRSSMKALNSGGLTLANAGFKDLTVMVTNFSQASGISADAIGQLAGNLTRFWSMGQRDLRNIVSSGAAAQKAFDLTSGQVEEMLKNTHKLHDDLAAMFNDGAESSKALFKGIMGVAGGLNKMGVNAQVAKSFIDDMVDPEKFDKSAALMRKLGISLEEQIDMMESAAGKNNFFDKLLTNLPALSKEIQSIQNPFARMQYAKNLGLAPEIAAKLAKSTEGDMRKILEDYKKVAKEDEALKEKQKNAQANEAKFGEQLMFLKMQVFMPMMQWVQKMYPIFWQFMKALSDKLQTVMSGTTGFLDGIFKVLQPMIDWFTGATGGGFFDALNQVVQNLTPAFNSLIDIIGDFLKKVVIPFVGQAIKKIPKILVDGIWTFIKEAPWWATLALVGIALGKFANSGLRFMMSVKEFSGAVSAFKMSQMPGGKVASKIPGLGGILSKIPGLGGIGVGTATAATTTAVGTGTAVGGAGVGATALGGLTKVGGVALKALGPIGLAIGALMGGIEGSEAMSKRKEKETGFKATTSEKTAGGMAGVMTLGIAPLIDKIFKTELTTGLGKALKETADSSATYFHPIFGTLKLIANFEDKALSLKQQKELEYFQSSEMQSKKLNKDEIKRYEELNSAMIKNKTTLMDGLTNFYNGFTSQLSNIKLKYIDPVVNGVKSFLWEASTFFENFTENVKNLPKRIETAWKNFKFMDLWISFKKSFGDAIDKMWESFNDKWGLVIFKNMFSLELAFMKIISGLRSKLPEFMGGFTKEESDTENKKLDQGNLAYKQFTAAVEMGNNDQGMNTLRRLAQNKGGDEYQRQVAYNAERQIKIWEEMNKTAKETKKIAEAGAGHQASIDKKTPEITTEKRADFFSSFVKGYALMDTSLMVNG